MQSQLAQEEAVAVPPLIDYGPDVRHPAGVWIAEVRAYAALSLNGLDRQVTDYRAVLPPKPGLPERRKIRLSNDVDRRGRLRDWQNGDRRVPAIDAFALGEVFRKHGLPGMSGFTGLYLTELLEDYVAALAVFSRVAPEAMLDLLYATPLVADVYARDPRLVAHAQPLQRRAFRNVNEAAAAIQKHAEALWEAWPNHAKVAADVDPAFSHALGMARFDAPFPVRERLLFIVLDEWARSQPAYQRRLGRQNSRDSLRQALRTRLFGFDLNGALPGAPTYRDLLRGTP